MFLKQREQFSHVGGTDGIPLMTNALRVLKKDLFPTNALLKVGFDLAFYIFRRTCCNFDLTNSHFFLVNLLLEILGESASLLSSPFPGIELEKSVIY